MKFFRLTETSKRKLDQTLARVDDTSIDPPTETPEDVIESLHEKLTMA